MAKTNKAASHFAKLGTPSDENPNTEPPKHSSTTEQDDSRGPWGIVAAIAIVVMVFCGVYLGGVWVFSTRFLPNTTLNGQDVSLLTLEEVASAHSKSTADYELKVTGEDFTLSIPASSVDLKSDGMAFAREAIGQTTPEAWPKELLTRRSITVKDEGASFSVSKLEDVLGKAIDAYNKQAKQPKDAKIEYDEGSKLFKVVPEEEGNALDHEAVIKAASSALKSLSASMAIGEDDVLKPKVFSDDEKLTSAVEDLNTKLSATQSLHMAGQEVFFFDSELVGRFSKVSDKYEFSFDEEAVRDWAQHDLSEQLDSVGTRRDYMRPDGKYVTVSGGNYGWNIDGEALAHLIAQNVMDGTEGTIDIPLISSADSYNPGGQDWSSRYIDIDITEQHVRFYDGGSIIWESDCVTGMPTETRQTPQGVYFLNDNKESGSVKLEGLEDPETGEPEYVSYVTYWMPFIWNAVALHDADWRGAFGGNIYQTDGSHGCVNLPPDKAAELFNICQVGDVVVVHT